MFFGSGGTQTIEYQQNLGCLVDQDDGGQALDAGDGQGGKTAMISNESAMFSFMIRRPCLAWSMACGIRRRSWPVKAMSADSIAASEPLFAREMDANGAFRTTWLEPDNIVGYPERYVHRPHLHPFDWVA